MVQITIIDETSAGLCEVYFAPAGATRWSYDYSGLDQWEIPPGYYDFYLIDCDGNKWDTYGYPVFEDTELYVSDEGII